MASRRFECRIMPGMSAQDILPGRQATLSVSIFERRVIPGI